MLGLEAEEDLAWLGEQIRRQLEEPCDTLV
jgi:hypothetical protein